MQLQGPSKVARVTRLVLAELVVVASTMVMAHRAHSQQDVDPTWYDCRPEASNTTQPSTPAANSKSKQQKNGSASRHRPPEYHLHE
jgi:hypothetical protein